MGLPEWVRTREGFEMKVSRQFDYTSFLLRLFGDLEPVTKRFFLANMSDGEAFLDVGANVGYFGLLVARQFPRSPVVAFEPNPAISECLQDSVRRNGWEKRMTVARNAVSSENGSLPFLVEGDNSGHSRLATGAAASQVIQVETVIFDEWVKTHPVGARVACVKIDVEGAEVMALRGMRNFLERDRPALCVEGYDNQLREFGSSVEELKQLIADAGYREVAPFDGNFYLKHESRLT
jgi:FkbM family methyltransferase